MSSSGEGSSAMLSLKNKIQMMREQVDRFKELYETANADLAAEKARKLELHQEVALLKDRIATLTSETEHVTSEYDVAAAKLEQTSKAADDIDRARRALEHRKNMDEDRLAVLEDLFKEANGAVMESERRYEELARKLLTAEADVQRTEEKAQASELKTKSLEEEMLALCNKIKIVQIADEKNSDRQEKYEASIKDLEIRLKNAQRNNEEADRIVANLEKQITHLKDELTKSTNQNQVLRSKIDPYSQELHGI